MSNQDTEEIVEQLAEQVEQLTGIVEQQAERIEELETELTEYRDYNERDKAKIRKNVTEVSEEIEEANADPSDPVEGEPDDPPIFNLLRTPDDQLNPTRRRTKRIWNNLKDWSEPCPAGRVMTNPQIRKALSMSQPDENGTKIDSTLARRVAEEIVAQTRGIAEIDKRDGRIRLVIPQGWEEKAREAYYDDHPGQHDQEIRQSDSVVGTV